MLAEEKRIIRAAVELQDLYRKASTVNGFSSTFYEDLKTKQKELDDATTSYRMCYLNG